MYRREFAKLIGMTGLSVMLPATLARQARAQDQQQIWGGPYFLHMHASGGWDPTIFCDGKLTSGGTTPDYENRIVKAVDVVNGVPVPVGDATGGDFTLKVNQAADSMEDPKDFFSRANVGGRMLVVNGVDTQTNNHETGVQGLACGHNDVELPAIAALFAGRVIQDKNIPLAFLAHGQYNRTGDVVGVSRFPGDKVGLLADPFRAASGDEKMMVSDVAAQRIADLRNKRLDFLNSQVSLPRNRRTLNAMINASKGGSTLELLKALADDPPPTFDSFRDGIAPSTLDYLSAPTNTQANAPSRFVANGAPVEVLLRCFAKGVSASATFAQGGFDTHDNHDINQQSAMAQFTSRLRYVLLRAQQLNLSDKLYILVTSDFGRTPKYNTGNGRDHWNVTSTLLAGPGIKGGTVVGKTDASFKAMRVGKGDITQTLEQDDDNGARIHPSNLHAELRRVAALDKASFIGGFPLPALENPLPLLG